MRPSGKFFLGLETSNIEHRTPNIQQRIEIFAAFLLGLDVQCSAFEVRCFLHKTKSPRPTLRSNRDKSGDGSAPSSLSRIGIRRALAGLPISRRYSPRQAESPAS